MKLIVFSGLPGTGKSMLAETIGRRLGIPVFAKDWLEAVLLQNGLKPTQKEKSLGYVGYELLTTLAERQLMLGQSVILDSVAGIAAVRKRWKDLAHQYHAEWRVIECLCSDETVHRARLLTRERNIPGWHELDWSEVERVKEYYVPWQEDHLVLDMVRPFEDNLSRVMAYCM
jgi:predicted kinase